MKLDKIYITETPRDALQGWSKIVPTQDKIDYINSLLRVGFDVVDVGSFVSPMAVPQMADTGKLMDFLEISKTPSRIMVVVGNVKGAMRSCQFDQIEILGFPYSTSPTFLRRNINSDPESTWNTLLSIQQIAGNAGKSIRVYLSMAFGNPYGDPWNEEQVLLAVENLVQAGFTDIVFSDITGIGTAAGIGSLCSRLTSSFAGISLGLHLHSLPGDWVQKVEAAWQAGFRRYEGAMGGYGGCPMSGYELLGNLDTSKLIKWCDSSGIVTGLDYQALQQSEKFPAKIFS